MTDVKSITPAFAIYIVRFVIALERTVFCAVGNGMMNGHFCLRWDSPSLIIFCSFP